MDDEFTVRPIGQPENKGDDMSDVFEVKSEDVLDGVDDAVAVDTEKDILDEDEDESIEDVVTVTDEDIMGDVYGQSPLEGASAQKKKKAAKPQFQIVRPYTPPSQISRIGE